MYLEIATGIFMLGDFVYHRISERHADHLPPPDREIDYPRIEDGTIIPLIFGRVRVRNPILAWAGSEFPIFAAAGGVWANEVDRFFFAQSQHFVCGIPMADGNATSGFHAMWVGEAKLGISPFSNCAPESLTGAGGFEPDTRRLVLSYDYEPDRTYLTTQIKTRQDIGEQQIFGDVEFLNGNPTQTVVDDSAVPTTYLGKFMTVTTTAFPGTPERDLSGTLNFNGVPAYRGYLSVFLFKRDDSLLHHWSLGGDNSTGSYSFEVSSYPDSGGYPAVGIYAVIGQDANPANIIWDVLVAKFGKLGLSSSLLDLTSFQAAAHTLYIEGHGYSRCFDEATAAQDIINDILQQIDGLLYQDLATGKVCLKLVRPDYDPATVMEITTENCKTLEDLAAGGWTGRPNKIRILYTDRANGYREGSATASNLANAVGQDGIVREQVLRFAGCCTASLAASLAARELAARSRPLIKCRAIVGAEFLRVTPGDVVKVTWRHPGISGLFFRVVAVDRGMLLDSTIALSLVQDFNYVWRNLPPRSAWIIEHLDEVAGL